MARIVTVFTVRPEIDNVVDEVPANLDVQRKPPPGESCF
jgi:hypothetical protein